MRPAYLQPTPFGFNSIGKFLRDTAESVEKKHVSKRLDQIPSDEPCLHGIGKIETWACALDKFTETCFKKT